MACGRMCNFKIVVILVGLFIPYMCCTHDRVDGGASYVHGKLLSKSHHNEVNFPNHLSMHTRRSIPDVGASHLAYNNSCPVWFKPLSPDQPHDCICIDKLQSIVQCNNQTKQAKLSIGYCMSYIEETGEYLVGRCPYNYFQIASALSLPLPQNRSKLEEFICGDLNREGLFCGRCKPGFGLSPIPLHYNCSDCSEKGGGYNWGRYLATDFLLQTVFILILFIFKISVTSPALGGYILFCQIVSITNVSVLAREILHAHNLTELQILGTTIFDFYSIWKLDFFSLAIPRQCLSEEIDSLWAIGLQYISAFYPLILILILYACIRLHDSQYKLFVWIYKPFHWCRVRIKHYYEFKQPVAHAFATVFLLSYVKVLDVSYSLLTPIQLFNNSGEAVYRLVWYFDASITFFQGRHIICGILALVVFCAYIFFPTLLFFFYPFKWFQKCLDRVHLQRNWLSIFMDIMQSPYKDGLNGTADLRSFVAIYFWIRILFVIIRVASLSHNWHYNVLSVLFIVFAVIVAGIRPFKKRIYNIIDCVFLCLLATLFHIFFLFPIYSSLSNYFSVPLFIIMVILGLLPMVYFLAYLLYHLFSSIKVPKKWKISMKKKWIDFKNIFSSANHRRNNSIINLESFDDSELPHRHLRPDLYHILDTKS